MSKWLAGSEPVVTGHRLSGDAGGRDGSRGRLRPIAGWLAGAWLVGCVPAPGFVTVPPDPCGGLPRGLDGLQEDGAARGLDLPVVAPMDLGLPATVAAIAARDLDGDGDVDLLLGRMDGPPRLAENAGDGTFVDHGPIGPPTLSGWGPSVVPGAVDVDGDDRPDVLVSGLGWVGWYRNRGDLAFDPPIRLATLDGPAGPTVVAAWSWGDLDGDGAPDLVLGGERHVDLAQPTLDSPPAVDEVRYAREGWAIGHPLPAGAGERYTLVTLPTDRDGDGDRDVWVGADHGPLAAPNAFFTNDGTGAPQWRDDAGPLQADLAMAAMGVASADLDGDGTLDYCITDIGGLRCLLGGQDGYVEAASALGLTPPAGSDHWTGWSIDLADLDNDGWDEVIAAAGQPSDAFIDFPWEGPHADGLWAGAPGGWREVGAAHGFGDVRDHYGLATADLDGDGRLEVLVAALDERVSVWRTGCSAGGWLDVQLRGLPPDTDAFGARVEVAAGGRTQVRELHGPRGQGQSDAVLHFGLGDAGAATVRVRWPDGAVSDAEATASGRLVLDHPAR